MSTVIKKQRTAKRKARSRVSAPRRRSDHAIAKKIVDQQLPDPAPLLRAEDTFDVIHTELKGKYPAELQVHVDQLEDAAELRCRLRKINAFENQIFIAMTDALDLRRPASSNKKEFLQVLDTLLRHNIFEKLAKYEAAIREQVRRSNQDLQEIEDWFILTGLKRGSIGYTVAHNLFSEKPELLEPYAPDGSRREL